MRHICLSLLVLCLAATMAAAQGYIDMNIMGVGARAHGMGGAFIGVADDATAVSWNPAGIAQLDKMEASAVGLVAIKKRNREVTGAGINRTNDETNTHFAPSFASFVIPLKVGERNLVGCVAYQRLIDLGFGMKDNGTITGTSISYEEKETVKGGVDAITPTMAIQVSKNLMLGVAGNIILNSAKDEWERSYVGYASSFRKSGWEEKYSGFNINTGVLATFDKFNIGAMIRLPFSMTTKYNETENWDLTSAGLIYQGTATGNTSYGYESKIKMPLMFGFGAAFKATNNLTLAADFESRQYSNSESEVTYLGQTTTSTMGWNNCNQVRAGLEYIITGSSAVFPIRLGFRTDPKVYNGAKGTFNASGIASDTSQVTGLVFTSGFGLKMGAMMLDLAGEYGMANIVDASGTGYAIKLKESVINIMASCIFHF